MALNFVPDPPRAVAEFARVARAGGVAAAYVWDYAGGAGVACCGGSSSSPFDRTPSSRNISGSGVFRAP